MYIAFIAFCLLFGHVLGVDDNVRDIDVAEYNSQIISKYLEAQHTNNTIKQIKKNRRRLKHFLCPDSGGKYCPKEAWDCSVIVKSGYQNQATIFNRGKGCLRCPLGYYVPPKNTSTDGQETYADECLLCAKGKFADRSGSSSCKVCPISRYQDQEGGPSCKSCQQGFVSHEPGLVECTNCNTGEFDLKEAQTTCSLACKSNQILVEGSTGRGLGGSKWYCINDPPQCTEKGNVKLNLSSLIDWTLTNISSSTNSTNSSSSRSSSSSAIVPPSKCLGNRCRCGDGLIGNCARGGYCPLLYENEAAEIERIEAMKIRTPLQGVKSKNAKNLQACIGKCDNDGQCAFGLKCFQRQKGESVPGCTGNGHSNTWNYCYDPTYNYLSGENKNSVTNLQACVGECDNDAQCASGLKCFLRENGEAVPGCVGNGNELDNGGGTWDYCYDKAAADQAAAGKLHEVLCRHGEFCWSNGNCNSYPEPLLKLEAIDSDKFTLDVDIGNDVPLDSFIDVAWASGGVPGQSQLLNFQSCLPYTLSVELGGDDIISLGVPLLPSFQHELLTIIDFYTFKALYEPYGWIALNTRRIDFCHRVDQNPVHKECTEMFYNFIYQKDRYTELESVTTTYDTFLDKCMIYCAQYQIFSVRAPQRRLLGKGEDRLMECACRDNLVNTTEDGLVGSSAPHGHRCFNYDSKICEDRYLGFASFPSSFTTDSTRPISYQFPWGASSIKQAAVDVIDRSTMQRARISVTERLKLLVGFQNELLLESFDELAPECSDVESVFCTFSLVIFGGIQQVVYHSKLSLSDTSPRIKSLYIDQPRQNGQIVVRSNNLTIYREDSYTYKSGVLLSCFVKKSNDWKSIYQKRWDIEQFPMGESITPFTFVHNIGLTCDSGTYTIRCGVAGIEKPSDNELKKAAASIKRCVKFGGGPAAEPFEDVAWSGAASGSFSTESAARTACTADPNCLGVSLKFADGGTGGGATGTYYTFSGGTFQTYVNWRSWKLTIYGFTDTLCSVEVCQQSYTCSESEYSYKNSLSLPVAPRSQFQFHKVSLSIAEDTSTPGMYIKNENEMRDLLGRITDNAEISDFTYLPKIVVDVALGRPGQSSLSFTLKDPLVTNRGPVEETSTSLKHRSVEDIITKSREKGFISSANQGGWWSVDLFPKPYSPAFQDFNVSIDLIHTVTRPEKLKVFMTNNFDPINIAETIDPFYSCGFNSLNECTQAPSGNSNSTDKSSLWSISTYASRSVTPEGEDAIVWPHASGATLITDFPTSPFPSLKQLTIEFWIATLAAPMSKGLDIINLQGTGIEYIRISPGGTVVMDRSSLNE